MVGAADVASGYFQPEICKNPAENNRLSLFKTLSRSGGIRRHSRVVLPGVG